MLTTINMLILGLVAFCVVCGSIVSRTTPVWIGLLLLFFGNMASGASSASSHVSLLDFWGRFFPTLAIGLLLLGVLARRSFTSGFVVLGRGFVFSFFPFCVLLVISAIYNDSGLRDTTLAFGTYLRYPLFFLLLINSNLPVEQYGSFIRVFCFLTLLQIPVTMYETVVADQWGANVEGTFGSNHGLVAVLLFAQCSFLSRWLVVSRGSRLYLGISFALLVPSLVGDIMIGIILFPIVAVFLILRHYGASKLWAATRRMAAMFLVVASLCGALYVTVDPIRSYLDSLMLVHKVGGYRESIDWRDKALANWASVGRLTILPLSFPLLLEDPVRLVWGFGPEAARGGVTSSELDSGVVCKKLLEQGIFCRGPQTFKSLMEFGIAGSFLQLVPFLFLWRSIGKRLRPGVSPREKTIWLTFQGACLLNILLLPWYIGAWRMDWFCLPFWLIVATAYVVAQQGNSLGSQTPYQNA
jgi:hypothetical protein